MRSINGIVYFLLAFFLGVLGIHRFYRGQIGLGIIYFFTGGLLGIGVLVDIIISFTWLFGLDRVHGNVYVRG